MATVTGSTLVRDLTDLTSISTTGNITVGGTVDGRDVATDGAKLDGIEASATADQTAGEILTAIKTVDGSGSGLDADTVDGIEATAITQSGDNVALTGDVTGATTVGADGSISVATTIAANSVELGTDTTGNYVESLVAGNLIDLQNNSGEGTTPTIDVDLSELTDMTGAAVETDELVILDAGSQKRKAINEITLGLFNTTNQIALGDDTTGNYVKQGATSGNGISGSVNSEGGTFTVASNATNINTGSTIVFRDENGNFFAEEITAALNGNANTATTATNVTASANNSTDETIFLTFVDGQTGSRGIETDTGLTYNPSTGLITSTAFSGNITSSSVDINGGSIDGTTIGSTTTSTGAFTTISASGAITASGGVTGNVTGNVTGDLTGDVTGNLTGNVTGNVTGDLTGNVTGDLTGNATNATNATNVAITNDTSTNSTHYVHFGSATSGNDGVQVSSSKLTFNPSSGVLSVNGVSVATTADLTASTSPNFSVDSSLFASGILTNGEGKAVYYDTSTNKWEGAYNDSSGEFVASHVIVDKSATDVKVASTGIFTLSGGLNANHYYFLSSTAGTATDNPDIEPKVFQPLYYALDANTIDLNIQAPQDTVITTYASGNNPGEEVHGGPIIYTGIPSDERLKENIESIQSDAISIVNELNPVSFDFKDPRSKYYEGQQLGFIAQEISEVIPQSVYTEDDEIQTMMLKPETVIPVLTKAIQELTVTVETLKRRVEELEGE
jgi:hypothetical protein